MSMIAAIVAGVSALAGGAAQSSRNNAAVAQMNRQTGIAEAESEYANRQINSSASKDAREIGIAELKTLAMVDMNTAQATADAQVSAAAVGAEGGSVQQQQDHINAVGDFSSGATRNKADAKRDTLTANVENSLMQVRTDEKVVHKGSNTGLLAALSGLSTFLSLR